MKSPTSWFKYSVTKETDPCSIKKRSCPVEYLVSYLSSWPFAYLAPCQTFPPNPGGLYLLITWDINSWQRTNNCCFLDKCVSQEHQKGFCAIGSLISMVLKMKLKWICGARPSIIELNNWTGLGKKSIRFCPKLGSYLPTALPPNYEINPDHSLPEERDRCKSVKCLILYYLNKCTWKLIPSQNYWS